MNPALLRQRKNETEFQFALRRATHSRELLDYAYTRALVYRNTSHPGRAQREYAKWVEQEGRA